MAKKKTTRKKTARKKASTKRAAKKAPRRKKTSAKKPTRKKATRKKTTRKKTSSRRKKTARKSTPAKGAAKKQAAPKRRKAGSRKRATGKSRKPGLKVDSLITTAGTLRNIKLRALRKGETIGRVTAEASDDAFRITNMASAGGELKLSPGQRSTTVKQMRGSTLPRGSYRLVKATGNDWILAR